jgi:sodium/bile acid cotransporter 7
MGAFLKKQFLPVGLVTVALIGLLYPASGIYMATLPTQYIAVTIIFICSGLTLRTEEIRKALSAWRATLWGDVSILLITPVLGAWLAYQLPLEQPFQLGLALFCCMPTTLSSGLALTVQARGNVAQALLLTVSTNLLGIFTVPFVLTLLLGTIGDIQLSAYTLLGKLCLTILLPLAIGKYLQRFISSWVQANKANITLASNAALISIPWMKFSESSERLLQVALDSLALLVLSGLLIHILFLILNDGVSRLLRLPLAARKAVVLLASQKTLPVAMTVLAFLPIEPQLKGLVAIPCITFHLSQIFLDAVIATHWGQTAD